MKRLFFVRAEHFEHDDFGHLTIISRFNRIKGAIHTPAGGEPEFLTPAQLMFMARGWGMFNDNAEKIDG